MSFSFSTLRFAWASTLIVLRTYRCLPAEEHLSHVLNIISLIAHGILRKVSCRIFCASQHQLAEEIREAIVLCARISCTRYDVHYSNSFEWTTATVWPKNEYHRSQARDEKNTHTHTFSSPPKVSQRRTSDGKCANESGSRRNPSHACRGQVHDTRKRRVRRARRHGLAHPPLSRQQPKNIRRQQTAGTTTTAYLLLQL